MMIFDNFSKKVNVIAALVCVGVLGGTSALSQSKYSEIVAERVSGLVEIWGVELESDTEDDPYVSILLVGRGADKGEESCSDHLLRIPREAIKRNSPISTKECRAGPVYSFKIEPNTYVVQENFIRASQIYQRLLPARPFRPQASSVFGTAVPPPVGILTCKGVNDCNILIAACIGEKNGTPECTYNDKGQPVDCYCL